jgi:hypothetical protein
VTTIGFYRVVQKPVDRKTGTLTIRARARADLDSLRVRYLPELGEIRETPKADYRFRAQASQAAVAEVLRRLVGDIDDDNFKDAVLERQGGAREEIYGRVWEELLAI